MSTPAASHKPTKHSHQWIDARNLAMSRLVAEKIRLDPQYMNVARDNLRRWKARNGPWPAYVEWEKIIRVNSVEGVLRILTEKSEEGNRLRQSDPFCGILTEAERLQFLDEYDAK